MNSEYDLCNNNGKVIGLRLISVTKNISYKLYTNTSSTDGVKKNENIGSKVIGIFQIEVYASNSYAEFNFYRKTKHKAKHYF